MHFPYGTGATVHGGLEHSRTRMQTILSRTRSNVGEFTRKLDNDTYWVDAKWTAGAKLAEVAKHKFVLTPAKDAESLEFVCAFAPKPVAEPLPTFDQTAIAARKHWNNSGARAARLICPVSKDPRWQELERRIVLSQYLTAIQCAGSYPPQETGLAYNSWYGKFHLEMHWWHAAHFALWNRLPLLERSLGYYQSILPRARGHGETPGLRGRALAEDDRSQRRGIAVAGRAVSDLAAAAPDFLRGAVLPRRTGPGDAGEVQGDRVCRPRNSWRRTRRGTRKQKRYVLGPVLQARRRFFRKTTR